MEVNPKKGSRFSSDGLLDICYEYRSAEVISTIKKSHHVDRPCARAKVLHNMTIDSETQQSQIQRRPSLARNNVLTKSVRTADVRAGRLWLLERKCFAIIHCTTSNFDTASSQF